MFLIGRSLHQPFPSEKQSILHVCIYFRGKGKNILHVFNVCLTNGKNKPFCNGHIFKPWHTESSWNTQKPVKHVWGAVFYRTLCNSDIFRTWGIFRTLLNIYDGKFYSQPYVTPAYLEPWHIQNLRHIQNTAKHLSQYILFQTLCNPDLFRPLVYSELWYILKSKHIQNPAEYRTWSILLRNLCN